MYVLDRFEGDKAIIEYSNNSDDNISVFEVEKSRISSDVREGDVIYCREDIFYTDKFATEERRKAVAKKLKELANPVKKKSLSEILRIYITINCVYLFQFVLFFFFPSFFNDLDILGRYFSLCMASLIFYVLFGICAFHVAFNIGILIYSIYNRIKHKVKKRFVFTLIITILSIILNIFGNSYGYWICRQ